MAADPAGAQCSPSRGRGKSCRGRLKIQVGLCKGKKNYDKRESIARKDAEREAARELRSRNQY